MSVYGKTTTRRMDINIKCQKLKGLNKHHLLTMIYYVRYTEYRVVFLEQSALYRDGLKIQTSNILNDKIFNIVDIKLQSHTNEITFTTLTNRTMTQHPTMKTLSLLRLQVPQCPELWTTVNN